MTPTDDLRAVFGVLADLLIPSGQGMPSASQVGVHEELIDQVLQYRPDLDVDFTAAVRACAGREPEAALDDLAAAHPKQFGALALLTAGAYVLSDELLNALEYTAPPQPVSDDLNSYIDLLAEVVERGFDIR